VVEGMQWALYAHARWMDIFRPVVRLFIYVLTRSNKFAVRFKNSEKYKLIIVISLSIIVIVFVINFCYIVVFCYIITFVYAYALVR